MKVEALDHLVVNVLDTERSAWWYEQVLGMRRLNYTSSSGQPRTAVLFGQQRINLRQVEIDQAEWITGRNAADGSEDLCFLVEGRPEEVLAHLHAHNIDVIEGPVARNGAIGTLTSIYCRDPDGNLIELSSYQ